MNLRRRWALIALGVPATSALAAQQPDSTLPRPPSTWQAAASPASDSGHPPVRNNAFPNDSVRRSRSPGRIITVDHTPNGTLRTTEFVFSPTVFYAPETGFGGGSGVVYSRTLGDPGHERRPTTLQASLQLTQEHQFTINSIGDLWTGGNEMRLTYELIWSHYPQLFYGIGPSTPNAGERWSPTVQRAALTVSKRLRPHLYVGVQGLVEHEILTIDDPGLLDTAYVPGQLGWNVVQFGTQAVFDTRVPYYYPLRGVLVNASVVRGDAAFGSEFTYTRAVLDVRGYHAIAGEHVLAAQLILDAVDGVTPFDRLPQLGGMSILRGMYDGRFRDQSALAAQGEYRTPAWHRFGGVVFAAVGAVAPTPHLFAGTLFHATGGVGLRFALTDDDRLNVRIDHGWGRGTSGTYFTIGEAF